MIYFNQTKPSTEQGLRQLQADREAITREHGRIYPASLILFYHDSIAEQAKTFRGHEADATPWLVALLEEVSGQQVALG